VAVFEGTVSVAAGQLEEEAAPPEGGRKGSMSAIRREVEIKL